MDKTHGIAGLSKRLMIAADDLENMRAPAYIISDIRRASDNIGHADICPEPLTKLEQFTMAAMQGLLACSDAGGYSVARDSLWHAQSTLAKLAEQEQ